MRRVQVRGLLGILGTWRGAIASQTRREKGAACTIAWTQTLSSSLGRRVESFVCKLVVVWTMFTSKPNPPTRCSLTCNGGPSSNKLSSTLLSQSCLLERRKRGERMGADGTLATVAAALSG
eukprot:5938-Pyramimonas_sp.AAC.1